MRMQTREPAFRSSWRSWNHRFKSERRELYLSGGGWALGAQQHLPSCSQKKAGLGGGLNAACFGGEAPLWKFKTMQRTRRCALSRARVFGET